MATHILGIVIIGLVYFCLFILAFSPTLYTGWIYLVSRKVSAKKKGPLKILLSTFCVNLIVVYFIVHLLFDYFLVAKVAEMESLVQSTMQNAIASQQKYFAAHGRYYPVGPVRGPYQDEHGLNVEKDVILEVEPKWDKSGHRETFNAYAVHRWGRHLLFSTKDGKVEQASPGSELETRMRSKLIQSVK
jgi:hypothetical protein